MDKRFQLELAELLVLFNNECRFEPRDSRHKVILNPAGRSGHSIMQIVVSGVQ